jgi:redox-sensing transcriptional repressor
MRKVPGSTITRLSVYLRLLDEVRAEGLATLSSVELSRRAGTTAAQVRKDLSFFGTFGKRGLGYSVAELSAALRSILGLERSWRVALVGAGQIGRALLGYEDIRRQGFAIEAVFDADPGKVGQRCHGIEVQASERLEEILGEGFDIAILAVPAEAAQQVAERVVSMGVRAILNFAPVKLRLPEGVALKSVNMALELESLSYALASAPAARARREAKA